MKVIVAGSRSINDYGVVKYAIEQSGFDITEVVSGTARGVDTLGEAWAHDNDIHSVCSPADWTRYGKRAGYVRNEEMGKYADALIAVWDGESKGTLHMINIMRGLQKPVFVLTVKQERG